MSIMYQLSTERLILRPFSLSDAEQVQRLAGYAKLAEFTLNIPHPYLDGMAEAWISSHEQSWQSDRGYTFAMTLTDSGKLIGCISLSRRPDNEAEVAYWVGVPYWGKGYCTEATKMMIQFAFEQLGLQRVTGLHLTRNPASGSVMKKAGMIYGGLFNKTVIKNGQRESLVFYSIDA
ncbi:GNAT family N-acetyltransferase [Motilimonas sp. KMU-193]|uniref:GNAT family N-acetyltransferase n=1 Tax=Motilimonas sp. KMU-193 TaxID=3388668 RepID=UPI00396AFDDC